MKRVYLDHAAATPLDPKVAEAMAPFWSEIFGNPSAIHREGVLAQEAVHEARSRIASSLGVHADEIIFTGSATESANLAILGAVKAWRETHRERTPHVIVSSIEHDAVLAPVRALLEEGVRVTRLAVTSDGVIDLSLLSAEITLDTVIISLQYANNEVGSIQSVAGVAKLIRKWKKEYRDVVRSHRIEGEQHYPLFHTDAVQAANYLDLNVPKLGVDLMTLNASKIYGPKGIGLLYKAKNLMLAPVVLGGGHEAGLRAGTENVPAIVGFAKALEIAVAMRDEEGSRLETLRNELSAMLTKEIEGLRINGTQEERLPNNLHFSLPDVDHEYLALLLDARGFAVATKSACNESDAEISHVLLSMAKNDDSLPVSGIRISMGRGTSRADIIAFVSAMKAISDEGLLLGLLRK